MKPSDRVRKALNRYQKKPEPQQGILGNEVGVIAVPNRTDYVYVRVAGLGTISVYNKRVPLILDLPVDVGYDPLEPKNFQVLNIHRYPQGGGRGLVDVATVLHGKTHGWTGTDPVYIEKRQLMPLRPTPLGGMQLYVTREVAWYDGEFVSVTGQQLDLAPYVPASGSLMVLVYKDTDEIVKVQTGGVLKDLFSLTLADAPEAYPGTVPIALVRLYGGQTGIAEGYQDTDLIDVRQLFSPILTGTGGGAGGGHVIQEEGSDLPARGHLNFVGAGVIASDDAGNDTTIVLITGSTGGGVVTGAHNIQDEGNTLPYRPALNFTGIGVIASDDSGNNRTNIFITGAVGDADTLDGHHADEFVDNVLSVAGDLIVASGLVNFATSANGASATAASTWNPQIPDLVLDEDESTFWSTTQNNAPPGTWITVDLGIPRTIKKFRFYQYTPHDTFYNTDTYIVRGSLNGTDWDDLITRDVITYDDSYTFPSPVFYRYFKFSTVDNVGHEWHVASIYLYGTASVVRLPIGDEGDILSVVSGTVAWEDPADFDVEILDWYDAKSNGLYGDNSHDDTTAFQNLINTATANGTKSATIYFPPGTYLITGSLQDAGAFNGQILLPSVSTSNPQITITLIGARRPPFAYHGSTPNPGGYSILKSTLAGATGTAACISGGNSGQNNVSVVLQDLLCIAPDNPTFTFWNLSVTQGGYTSGLMIMTAGVWAQTSVTQPTNTNAYGIKLPQTNNSDLVIIDSLVVCGFYTGVLHGELVEARYIIAMCWVGIEVPFCYHPGSHIWVVSTSTPYGIRFTGVNYVDIWYDAEHSNPAAGGFVNAVWAEIVYDIEDGSNYWYGDARWQGVLAGVGVDNDFTITGGANASWQQIGKVVGGDVATDTIWTAKGDLVVGTGIDTAIILPVGSNGQVLTVASGEASGLKWNTITGSGGGGDVATDAIWDAKGDIAAGTGANTAARLPVGTNGEYLKADSSQATGLVWDTPAGAGDVVGPTGTVTDNHLAVFDTDGHHIKDGGAIPAGAGWAYPADGRLTLESGVPISLTNQTSKTTLYYTPYKGDQIALYNGVTWDLIVFTELSIAIPATTSQMYDVFCYNNSGTATLELLAWTNDTTRATALAYQSGVLVKSGAATRRYLGSIRTTTVSGKTEDSLVRRFVWNYYNRVERRLSYFNDGATITWTIPDSSSFRAFNGDTNWRVEAIVGVAEDAIHLTSEEMHSAGTAFHSVAIMDNGTTIAFHETPDRASGFTGSNHMILHAHGAFIPAIGYHYFNPSERSEGATSGVYIAVGAADATISGGFPG